MKKTPKKPGKTPCAGPGEEGTFKWHIIQSSITIATAFAGAAVGNFLATRGERQNGR
jgi:hypothetical protein